VASAFVSGDALVLASASPRRADLLRGAGWSLTIRPVDCDEDPRPGEPAPRYVQRIARAKLDAAAAADVPVLAADTTVWHAHPPDPIAKPRDRAHAREMLETLTAGVPHRVSTAFAIRWPDGRVVEDMATTVVWMRPLDADAIERYLDRAQWHDKAGGYGIQDDAAGLVTRIEGSYTNVVGLPLAQVLHALRPEGPR
jgi:septum formation protein